MSSPKQKNFSPEHVELTGIVPRSEVKKHFKWADVFLLPSLCEGSATVTYEALSVGLPIIATQETGSIIRHGEDGFIVPPRDSRVIVEKLVCLLENPNRYNEMSNNAKARLPEINIGAYGKRLLKAICN